jgi:hypothetical protein
VSKCKIDTSQKPYVENYPALHEWLQKLEARCDWQLPIGPAKEPHAYVEQWSSHSCRPFVVIIYANNNGWNVFTDCADGRVDATLRDAEVRTTTKAKAT